MIVVSKSFNHYGGMSIRQPRPRCRKPNVDVFILIGIFQKSLWNCNHWRTPNCSGFHAEAFQSVFYLFILSTCCSPLMIFGEDRSGEMMLVLSLAFQRIIKKRIKLSLVSSLFAYSLDRSLVRGRALAYVYMYKCVMYIELPARAYTSLLGHSNMCHNSHWKSMDQNAFGQI